MVFLKVFEGFEGIIFSKFLPHKGNFSWKVPYKIFFYTLPKTSKISPLCTELPPYIWNWVIKKYTQAYKSQGQSRTIFQYRLFSVAVTSSLKNSLFSKTSSTSGSSPLQLKIHTSNCHLLLLCTKWYTGPTCCTAAKVWYLQIKSLQCTGSPALNSSEL